MKSTKRVFVQFAFYDRTGIKTYLEKQAQAGWMLQKIGAFGWLFRKTEPRQIHFCVTYFPKSSLFEPEPTEEQQLFWDFCAHAGWKLAVSNERMQIFYNEHENPVPIETEPALEVEKIHQSSKKSFLSSYFILLICALMQIGMLLQRLSAHPFEILGRNLNLFALASWTGAGLWTLGAAWRYFHWYKKAKRAAEEEGTFLETKGHGRGSSAAGLVLFGAFWLAAAYSTGSRMVLLMFAFALAILTGTLLVVKISVCMKRRNVSAAGNRLATVISGIVVYLVIVQLAVMVVLRGGGELFSEKVPVERREYGEQGHRTFDVYDDELPLRIEDLTREQYEGYSYEGTWTESVFLTRFEGRQRPYPERTELPYLEYTVTGVKAAFLYDWYLQKVKDSYFSEENKYRQEMLCELRETDAALWGADAAYRYYEGDEALQEFVICFGDSIVVIRCDWELTEEQMRVAGEKLGEV